jgi:hypothetical protein
MLVPLVLVLVLMLVCNIVLVLVKNAQSAIILKPPVGEVLGWTWPQLEAKVKQSKEKGAGQYCIVFIERPGTIR